MPETSNLLTFPQIQKSFRINQSLEEKTYLELYTNNMTIALKDKKSVLKNFSGEKMSILSLGCGFSYELYAISKILTPLNIQIASYTGVEINNERVKSLNSRLAKYPNVTIYSKPIKNFLNDNTQMFDMIILGHPSIDMMKDEFYNISKIIKQSLNTQGVLYLSCYKRSEYKAIKAFWQKEKNTSNLSSVDKYMLNALFKKFAPASDNTMPKGLQFPPGQQIPEADSDCEIDHEDLDTSMPRLPKNYNILPAYDKNQAMNDYKYAIAQWTKKRLIPTKSRPHQYCLLSSVLPPDLTLKERKNKSHSGINTNSRSITLITRILTALLLVREGYNYINTPNTSVDNDDLTYLPKPKGPISSLYSNSLECSAMDIDQLSLTTTCPADSDFLNIDNKEMESSISLIQ